MSAKTAAAMADGRELPCDGDGVCMVCKAAPPEEERLLCGLCASPWHAACLARPPASVAATLDWHCPDCSPAGAAAAQAPAAAEGLVARVLAIEADPALTEKEKARRRQVLLGGAPAGDAEKDAAEGRVLAVLDQSLMCHFCMEMLDRPVSIPCGHNFCLKCFQKWIGQGKRNCAKCRSQIPSKICSQPRINSTLVTVIRMARTARSSSSSGAAKVSHFVHNQDRPDKAFTTERAKKSGKANASSGKIFVTVPPDHFGPILSENDPGRNLGVLVGETWEDRMDCRQWGAHLPHVAGIAGQSDYGAQSVALSGGYEDDEDHGEWFLYTGSGGRDLSGNKRTNKLQSFDQKFDKLNEALRVSCKKGYPVRVVRSHKEKRSSYAPESGVRYDGVYRIEKCWRKHGVQGYKVCRYLFVRCDNEPAPWTSDEHGDRPRPLPVVKELKNASDITDRKEDPSWDYDDEHGWHWMVPPPPSKKVLITANPEERKMARRMIKQAQTSMSERLLKEFSCQICRNVLNLPMTTPCAHNFCKSCLEDAFAGKSFVRERGREGGRSLRQQKNVMKCPCCPTDISEFLQNAQVNTDLKGVIETLQNQIKEETEKVDEVANESDNDTEDESTEKENVMAAETTAVEIGEEKDTHVDDKLHQAADMEAPAKGRNKRKKSDNAAKGERGGKRTRASPEVQEGEGSPSSPLHVLSEGDE